jgi:hypothetical protein
MRRFAVAAWVLLLAAAGCTDNAPGGPGSTVGPPTTAPAPASGRAGKQWTMPNLVGRNLQEAQDAMQKLTGDPVFLTTSHDATGAQRQQLVDHNWKVCSQTPAAGTKINMKSVVDFGAVKTAESCP